MHTYAVWLPTQQVLCDYMKNTTQCLYIHAFIHTYMHAVEFVQPHNKLYIMPVYTYVHAYTYIHTYIHIHTYMHAVEFAQLLNK